MTTTTTATDCQVTLEAMLKSTQTMNEAQPSTTRSTPPYAFPPPSFFHPETINEYRTKPEIKVCF